MTYTFRDLANAQHGPSKAVLGVTTDAPLGDVMRLARDAGLSLDCPECGGPLDLHGDVDKLDVATGDITVPHVAFCCCCEFAKEF